jgi:tetratricopeptide (TPR) repeat protein
MSNWNTFPYDASAFSYTDEQLSNTWTRLHRGDQVEFPDADCIRQCLEISPGAAPAEFDGDIEVLAKNLQDAWRYFHGGEFEAAVGLACLCGALGHAPANKAEGIYASYLEPDPSRQKIHFMAAVERAEMAIALMPEDPNSHYFLAFNLGRYSQSISIVDALRQGIGGRIETALNRTLELAPDHAEAHTAFGLYHAEIIDKVGKMIGGMTYGASIDQAMEHFETALELTPSSPIAHIEFGNGLYLLFGDRRLDEVTELYVKASEMLPRDAMEQLDIAAALAELE